MLWSDSNEAHNFVKLIYQQAILLYVKRDQFSGNLRDLIFFQNYPVWSGLHVGGIIVRRNLVNIVDDSTVFFCENHYDVSTPIFPYEYLILKTLHFNKVFNKLYFWG